VSEGCHHACPCNGINTLSSRLRNCIIGVFQTLQRSPPAALPIYRRSLTILARGTNLVIDRAYFNSLRTEGAL
jgi:hypothetical protein